LGIWGGHGGSSNCGFLIKKGKKAPTERDGRTQEKKKANKARKIAYWREKKNPPLLPQRKKRREWVRTTHKLCAIIKYGTGKKTLIGARPFRKSEEDNWGELKNVARNGPKSRAKKVEHRGHGTLVASTTKRNKKGASARTTRQ